MQERQRDLKVQLNNSKNENTRLKEWIKQLQDEKVVIDENLEAHKKRSKIHISNKEEELQGAKTELNKMSEECKKERQTSRCSLIILKMKTLD